MQLIFQTNAFWCFCSFVFTILCGAPAALVGPNLHQPFFLAPSPVLLAWRRSNQTTPADPGEHNGWRAGRNHPRTPDPVGMRGSSRPRVWTWWWFLERQALPSSPGPSRGVRSRSPPPPPWTKAWERGDTAGLVLRTAWRHLKWVFAYSEDRETPRSPRPAHPPAASRAWSQTHLWEAHTVKSRSIRQPCLFVVGFIDPGSRRDSHAA